MRWTRSKIGLLATAALWSVSGCGGETIQVGFGAAAQKLGVDAGDAAVGCTTAGVQLDTIYTSQGVSSVDYAYGASGVTCQGFPAQQIAWTNPVEGALIGLYHQVPANALQGHETELIVHLRGEAVGSAIVEVNMIDDQGDPVGFQTSQGSIVIEGTFDWTAYSLTFETPSNASSLTLGVDLSGAGTLDVASVEVNRL